MTTDHTASTHVAPDRARPTLRDAIALLTADHLAVSQLFAAYEKTRSVLDKKALVAEICTTLSVHAQVEEEIFYPELKDALKGRALVPEASIERSGLRMLIAQLQGGKLDGEMVDAKVKVLFEQVQYHVREEQDEIFTRAQASSLDMLELGARMAARRDDLLARAA